MSNDDLIKDKVITGTNESDELSLGMATRRDVLKGVAALSTVSLLPKLAFGSSEDPMNIGEAVGVRATPSKRPNILFITVDEMRFPSQFPAGINSPGEFLQKFMPNTYSLWQRGVKFSKHFSAANDCTPARGTIATGLYAHQTWCVNTLVYAEGSDHADSPPLNSDFPTYGKLLRQAGYKTPYIGKWHLSVPPPPGTAGYLEDYGFTGFSNPDPIANNLQGTYGDLANGYYNDDYIANQAVEWLNSSAAQGEPWCLTVGFQNPHDKEFFPAGTEYQSWTQMYSDPTINPDGLVEMNNHSLGECAVGVNWDTNVLKNPPSYGYDAVPDNWESQNHIFQNKPSWQSVMLQVQAVVFGGVGFSPDQSTYVMEQYPTTPGLQPSTYGILRSPYLNWQRSLDSYTQIMEILDQSIGKVLNGLPESVAKNTVVIFLSDHGDYAGSHGMVSGKTGSFYNEIANVPFIVYDPTSKYTGDTDIIRNGITSHVDILPMLVSMAYGGRQSWMRGDLQNLYGNRHNIMPMLKSAKAPGRKAAYFSTDETLQNDLNFLYAPEHILGMVTQEAKVAIYSRWYVNTTKIDSNGQEREFYDYSTDKGRLEIESTPGSIAATTMAQKLLTQGLKKELQKPLPKKYRGAQFKSQQETIAYFNLNESSVLGG